jgi:hypothetical protein
VQTTSEIRKHAIYGRDPFRPHPTAGSAVATNPVVRAKVLAEAIPAMSRATGANAILGSFSGDNFDMMIVGKSNNRWPASRIANDVKQEKWLHGDFRDVAYFFVHPLYNDICTRGGLR